MELPGYRPSAKPAPCRQDNPSTSKMKTGDTRAWNFPGATLRIASNNGPALSLQASRNLASSPGEVVAPQPPPGQAEGAHAEQSQPSGLGDGVRPEIGGAAIVGGAREGGGIDTNRE